MNAKELFQKEVLEDIRAIAKELSQVQSFSGLLAHQQKIQGLYEKYIFLKQLNMSKNQQILDTSIVREVAPLSFEKKSEVGSFHETQIQEVIREEGNTIAGEIKKEHEILSKEKIKEEEEDKKLSPIDMEIERIKNNRINEEKIRKENSEKVVTLSTITEEIKPVVQEEGLSAKEEVIEDKPKGITPLSIEIADFKSIVKEHRNPVKEEVVEKAVIEEIKSEKINYSITSIKERELRPVKLDFNDSIAFISQLFKGSKANMDMEFKQLNETQTIGEAKKWMEDMFHKYNWKDKEDFVERLSGLIIHRFE